jgi:hypothetical protein
MCYPRTELPPPFAPQIAAVFQKHEPEVSTMDLKKGLTSDEVLALLRDDLGLLGFQVEGGKQRSAKIQRPVLFGENGLPELNYEVDAYHPDWRCGLEIEAGRAWMGNAVYRDLIQALVMVQVDVLALAVPNNFKYLTGGRGKVSYDYRNMVAVAETLFSHT